MCFYHDKQELPVSTRPIFCSTMHDVVVCFTGFKDKDNLVVYLEQLFSNNMLNISAAPV